MDGPLEGEAYALDLEAGDELSLTLTDGRVAVYKAASWGRLLEFVGYDPFA